MSYIALLDLALLDANPLDDIRNTKLCHLLISWCKTYCFQFGESFLIQTLPITWTTLKTICEPINSSPGTGNHQGTHSKKDEITSAKLM